MREKAAHFTLPVWLQEAICKKKKKYILYSKRTVLEPLTNSDTIIWIIALGAFLKRSKKPMSLHLLGLHAGMHLCVSICRYMFVGLPQLSKQQMEAIEGTVNDLMIHSQCDSKTHASGGIKLLLPPDQRGRQCRSRVTSWEPPSRLVSHHYRWARRQSTAKSTSGNDLGPMEVHCRPRCLCCGLC